MSKENKETCYEIISKTSFFKKYPFEGITKVAEELQNGYIVLWQHHGVFIGKIEKGKIESDNWLYQKDSDKRVYEEHKDENIVRIRAFNKNKEVHVWRTGKSLTGRLRIDDEGNSCEYIDTGMLLRGVIAEPLTKKIEEYKSIKKLSITTRNYIDYNDIGQAGFVDSRFVEFIKL